jgi:type II secretory pathway pseudopilin PulG
LIELLVAIAVLAAMALIVVPNLTGVASHAWNVRCATDRESMQSASSAYKNDHGAYATPGGGAGVVNQSLIVPYYLHTWPDEKAVWSIDANGSIQQSFP